MNTLALLFLINLLRLNCISTEENNSFDISTCCSTNNNDRIFLSCSSNEHIQLNLIEIFYNSNEFCSLESTSCCQTKTSCSRRLTKYYHSNCHQRQSCFIEKTCFKIYSSCSHPDGLFGQFISINYSCLTIHNRTQQDEDEEDLSPVIVKLSTSDQASRETTSLLKSGERESSPIYLLMLIFMFVVLLIVIYSLADFIGRRFCRESVSDEHRLSSHLIYLNKPNEKINVQSTIPKTRIYPKEIYSFYPYQTLINVHHDPLTGQVFSTTFYPRFNYY